MPVPEVKKLYCISLFNDSLSVAYVTTKNCKLFMEKDVKELKGDVNGF
jgi:hypothetical protein